jgi:hypothetical protein
VEHLGRDRVAAVAGVLFVVAFVVGQYVAPDLVYPEEQVGGVQLTFYVNYENALLAQAILFGLASALLLVFVGGLRAFLARAEGPDPRLAPRSGQRVGRPGAVLPGGSGRGHGPVPVCGVLGRCCGGAASDPGAAGLVGLGGRRARGSDRRPGRWIARRVGHRAAGSGDCSASAGLGGRARGLPWLAAALGGWSSRPGRGLNHAAAGPSPSWRRTTTETCSDTSRSGDRHASSVRGQPGRSIPPCVATRAGQDRRRKRHGP